MNILIWIALFGACVVGQTNIKDYEFNREVHGLLKGTEESVQDRFGNDEKGSSAPDTDYNPCLSPVLNEPPDFSAPGRRISLAKCYHYIWYIKYLDDASRWPALCSEYRRTHPNYTDGPYFAIGGHDTSPGEYPHMAAVGWKSSTGTWIFKCGGTLISDRFVLTAAHCTKTSPRDPTVADPIPKIVRLGDKNIADVTIEYVPPEEANILEIIVHPSYKPPRKYFDIALLKIGRVYFTKLIMPACLWSKDDTRSLGTEAILTGWGVTETAGRTTSPELQAAEVDVIGPQQCDQLLKPSCNRHWCGVHKHQICAGKLAGGVDACQGDSGGPLQVKIKLPVTEQGQLSFVIGVTSFGIGCARPNTPGVYTRVSSFIDWIEEKVWPQTSN